MAGMEEIGFQFSVLYRDNDLVKVRVSASNSVFRGVADLYLGTDQLSEVATQLRGFPKSVSDIREVTLGTFGPDSAGGGVSMRFYCIDRSGHACVETRIEADRDSTGRAQSAVLLVLIEASGVDSFVEELRRLNAGTAAAAYLRATVSPSDLCL
jgi:hypothetical protein